MGDSNIYEAADTVVFHTEMQPVETDTHIILRATKDNFTIDDINEIASIVTEKTGIKFSGRVVPESEHKLIGETLIDFYPTAKEAE